MWPIVCIVYPLVYTCRAFVRIAVFLNFHCKANMKNKEKNIISLSSLTAVLQMLENETASQHWRIEHTEPCPGPSQLPTAFADCVQCALSSVSVMPYFRFFKKCRANWVRQGTRRLKLALKPLKCLFFCSSYFFIIMILIITPRIFYTCYVAKENSEKMWKGPKNFG